MIKARIRVVLLDTKRSLHGPNQITLSWETGFMSGEQLAETRREMGWSQYFLADVLEIPRSSITHWECNRAPVPSNIASAVKKASRSMLKLKADLARVAWT
jgi:DNA-binding transcriptional regulator YiaG